MDSRPVFTIDLEDWNDALHVANQNHTSLGSYDYLIDQLNKRGVIAIVYGLRYLFSMIRLPHLPKTHGAYHRWWEIADRRPYQWLGLTGGFYFRFLPYWFVKRQILKHGMIYLHPHDLDVDHPKLKNPFLNWKRHVGLKTARAKLERLLKEVEFRDPRT